MTSHESLVAQSDDLKPVKKDEEERKYSDMGEPLTAGFPSLRFFVLRPLQF